MENSTFYTSTTSMANLTSPNLTTSSSGDVRPPDGCVVLALVAGPGAFIPWDNPQNLISRELEQAVDEAVAVVFLPVLFTISAPTNLLNMLVFFRQGLGVRINLCLFCLSLADLLYMVHSFLFNVDRIAQQFSRDPQPGLGAVFEFIVSNHLMFLRGFTWVSGFLSMLIACERCFCVMSPLRSQTVLQTKTTAAIVAMSTVLLLGSLYIATIRWAVACVYDPLTDRAYRTMFSSQFYQQNQEWVDTFTGIVVSLVLPALYISVVTATTITTSLKLRKMAAWRGQTSSAAESMSSREVALTRMLIGVSVLYVICSLPVLALGVSMLSVPDFSLHGHYYNAFNLMVSFFELFSYVNSSFNFFVYCFLGSKYRDTLRDIVRGCCLQVLALPCVGRLCR